MGAGVAVVTGASRGLGRALARALAAEGWSLVLDARDRRALAEVAAEVGGTAVPGDVTDAGHRRELVAAAAGLGGIDLLVNNAGTLGVEPLVPLAEADLDGLRRAFEVNAVASLGLVQEALPLLRASGGAVLNISSEAAAEPYPTWGAYGSSKAAVDLWSAVLGVEEPGLRVWALDPGSMRTEMLTAADAEEAAAAPGPEERAVPAVLRLLADRPESGRYEVGEVLK
ncbi:SDR family oxidoreductase [Streptacidiphilus monticola]|uniref:SDR family oxidoreductase n=1 Tax=Streptacidiphilus monticola TaxID=2161674 RepID=A0ABW1G074_9ACTN